MKLRVDGELHIVTHSIAQNFPGAILKSSHRNVLTFQLLASQPIARVFAYLEAEKQNLQLMDYSLSQTTLDQVR